MSDVTKSIIVVGSSNVDLVAKAPRIPVAGETLTGTDFAHYGQAELAAKKITWLFNAKLSIL